MKSTRKPHNELAGYVCELKSKHPRLPGHIGIFRTKEAGLDCGDNAWAVAHLTGPTTMGCFVGLPSLRTARSIMKDMAAGGNIADLGQHEKTSRPFTTQRQFDDSKTEGHPDYKPHGFYEDER